MPLPGFEPGTHGSLQISQLNGVFNRAQLGHLYGEIR